MASSNKRTNVIVWTSVAAAAAGIAAVVAIAKWRERSLSSVSVTNKLRDVQDVLTDCYDKVREIEAHLPAALNLATARATATLKPLTNGSGALESS